MSPFIPDISSTVAAAATAATAETALVKVPDGSFQLRLFNLGPNTVFMNRGPKGVVATLGGYPIPVGCVEVITCHNRPDARVESVAVICAATQTATLYCTIGTGD
jgi:hypothetical protein